jgi:hypothetical protein
MKRSGWIARATQQRALTVLVEMLARQRKGHNATRHVCYNVALSQRGDCLTVEVIVILHTSRKQRQRQWTAFL